MLFLLPHFLFDTCTFSVDGLDYFSTVEASAAQSVKKNLHLCFDLLHLLSVSNVLIVID